MMLRVSTIGVALLAISTACATRQAPEMKPSGFLSDPSLLKPGASGQALLVYQAPDADFSRNHAVLIDPVTAWRDPGAPPSSVPEADMQQLVNLLHSEVARSLRRNFSLVDKPGPGVLRIRLALTEAEGSNVPLDVVSTVVPIGRAISVVDTLTTGTASFVGSASIEGEITDSETGKTLFAAADRRVGGKTVGGVLHSWDDVHESFRVWAERMRAGLLEAGLQANWDQERVKELAKQLDRAVEELLTAARVQDPAAQQGVETYLFAEDLSRLKRHTRRLVQELSAHGERLKTTPLFLRVLEIVRTLRGQAQTTPLAPALQPKIEAARGVLSELARFYGEVWPPEASGS